MRIVAAFWLTGVTAFCQLHTPAKTGQHNAAQAAIVITHVTVINPGTSSVQSKDIRPTQKIAAVLARGRLFESAELDQILVRVEAAAKRP